MQVPIELVKYISLTHIDFIFRSHEICDPSVTRYILPLETHYLANPGKQGICSGYMVRSMPAINYSALQKIWSRYVSRLRMKSFRF